MWERGEGEVIERMGWLTDWQEFHRSLVDTVFPGKQQQQVLLYNRVPKTGSTSLMNILYELQSFNRQEERYD